MLYSCTLVATVDVKGLTSSLLACCWCCGQSVVWWNGGWGFVDYFSCWCYFTVTRHFSVSCVSLL